MVEGAISGHQTTTDHANRWILVQVAKKMPENAIRHFGIGIEDQHKWCFDATKRPIVARRESSVRRLSVKYRVGKFSRHGIRGTIAASVVHDVNDGIQTAQDIFTK